jgi:hypothetical protein
MNTAPRTFIALIVVHLFASLAIQAMEYLTNTYFFVYEAKDGTELDERLYGGGLDLLRAKGLFQGPLSAVAFAAWVAFLYRGRVLFAGLLLISSFLASGRLGIMVAALLLVSRILSARGNIPAKMSRVSVLIVTAILGTLVVTADVDRLHFIATALDQEATQNVSRVYFWITSVDHYVNYDWINIFLGKFGFIREQGGTENDFLRILLDNGLVVLLIYLVGLAWVLKAAIQQRSAESVIAFMLIVAMMNVFPFIQSLNSAILFWMFVLIRARAFAGQTITCATTMEASVATMRLGSFRR